MSIYVNSFTYYTYAYPSVLSVPKNFLVKRKTANPLPFRVLYMQVTKTYHTAVKPVRARCTQLGLRSREYQLT